MPRAARARAHHHHRHKPTHAHARGQRGRHRRRHWRGPRPGHTTATPHRSLFDPTFPIWQVTMRTLRELRIPYHELAFGADHAAHALAHAAHLRLHSRRAPLIPAPLPHTRLSYPFQASRTRITTSTTSPSPHSATCTRSSASTPRLPRARNRPPPPRGEARRPPPRSPRRPPSTRRRRHGLCCSCSSPPDLAPASA